MSDERDPVIEYKEHLLRQLINRGISVDGLDLTKVKPGDTVTRMLAGIVAMRQVVTKVDDQFIYTGPPNNDEGWRFWRNSGFEYDPDLNLPEGVICSYLSGYEAS